LDGGGAAIGTKVVGGDVQNEDLPVVWMSGWILGLEYAGLVRILDEGYRADLGARWGVVPGEGAV